MASDEQEYDRERKKAKRAAGRDIQLLPPADLARRRACLEDPFEMMRTYFGWIFWQPFTAARQAMVESIIHAARYSGDYAVADKRGGGKSGTALFATLWLDLRSEVELPIFIGKNQRGAEGDLSNLKQAIVESPNFADDFPEICTPIIALEDWASAARKQTVNGYHTKIGWEKDCLFLPNVPQEALPSDWPMSEASVARGQGFAVVGIDGKIRGFKRRNHRPGFAIIDDIDDRESARSELQTADNRKAIDNDTIGLAGSGKRTSRVMLCTTLNETCVAAIYTALPSWRGQRFRAIVTMPERIDLRDEYLELRKVRAKDDPDARIAHAFYLEHQAELERGGVVDNPYDFVDKPAADGKPLEVSALQHYFNLIADTNWDSFLCEYQNDPPPDESTSRLVLTSYHIQNNCLSGLERRHVPEGTVAVTIGADVQKLGLHYVVIAWDEAGVGCIIDYDFFEFQTKGKDAADCELLILEGLFAWREALEENPFIAHDGEAIYADVALIDMGWKDQSWNDQPVQLFCAQAGFAQFMPSKGMSPYNRPKPNRHLVIGDNWHWDESQWTVFMNSDHWKLKVHEGFLLERGEDGPAPGSLLVFDPPQIEGRRNRTFHLSYAKHVTSETWETRFMPGFRGSRTGWWKSPKPNHYFDATYQGIVARSMRGISVLNMPPHAAPAVVAVDSQIIQPPVANIYPVHSRNRW